MTKAIAKKDDAVLALIEDMQADASTGLENVDTESFTVPFLQILQGLSPALKTVDGAKPGLLFNNISKETFKDALVIPCAYNRCYLRWRKRDEGGGFKGRHSTLEVETGKIEGLEKVGMNYELRYQENGKEVVDVFNDTRVHYCLAQNLSGAWGPVVISCSSTQIKKSKNWVTQMMSISLKTKEGKTYTPPTFSQVYKVSTVEEKNVKGEFYGWNIELFGPVDSKEIYEVAKRINQDVSKGIIKEDSKVFNQD